MCVKSSKICFVQKKSMCSTCAEYAKTLNFTKINIKNKRSQWVVGTIRGLANNQLLSIIQWFFFIIFVASFSIFQLQLFRVIWYWYSPMSLPHSNPSCSFFLLLLIADANVLLRIPCAFFFYIKIMIIGVHTHYIPSAYHNFHPLNSFRFNRRWCRFDN